MSIDGRWPTLLASLLLFAVAVFPPDIASEVARYRLALHDVESKRASIEQAYTAAVTLGTLLLEERDGDSFSRIELLTEAEYESLERQVRGMIVNREEVVFAEPDPKYFLDLARKHGTATDIQFFRNLAATYPDGVWPSYVQQQTDVTACTDFGSHELVTRYADWLAFRAKHPHAYSTEVAKQLEEIEGEIASTCACGDEQSVIRELEDLVRRVPGSPAASKARKRLKEIAKPEAGMRYHCISG